jgi:hypothetical protein
MKVYEEFRRLRLVVEDYKEELRNNVYININRWVE